MIGMILGNRYELLEKIGEGGMAHVYKAKCNKLNRFVAVKILKKEFANNEDICEKFKREATAIANLSDTNIVNILDVGTQDDISYIVMEYVKGKTLKDIILFNGKLTYSTTIKIALQVAKALDCAHKNNIIHRDVKPQNILVTEDGDVKVTDFGIAKSTDSATITNTTSVMGSAHYLSPEQAKGGYLDCRTDIYSFGVVLYEMVAGKLPFEGDAPVTIALKHLQEIPVPPKVENASIPESLNKMILKLMEKEPIKRYQSFKDIIHDLQRIQQDPDIVIGTTFNSEDQHTIVMDSIGLNAAIKDSVNNSSSDHYEDDEEEEEEEEDSFFFRDKKSKDKNKKPKNYKGKIITIIAVLIAVIALGVGGYFLTGVVKPKEVKVPNIVDKTVEQATEELKKIGLELEEVGTQKSDKPEGTILEVDPKVGTTVKEKTKVKVVISGGKEKIIMPDFRDFEVNNIKQYLESKGFTNYSIEENYSDTVEKGYLISQNPAPKTEVNKDTAIEIIVSKGAEVKLVQVSNVVGMTESEGKGTLEKLRLNVSVEYKDTNNKGEENKILSQSIIGSKVEEGTSITISVGKFKEKEIDLRSIGLQEGISVLEAKSILKGAGINNISYNGPSGDSDIVIGFTEKIKEGGSVTLTTKKKEVEPTPPTDDKHEEETNPKPGGHEGERTNSHR